MLHLSAFPLLLTYESIIALTVHITALFITGYLLRLPNKAPCTWWFSAFFLGITLVSATIFLEASILVWGNLFFALRVVVALCAQASLTQFAYHFPDNDQPREARALRWFFLGLILVAASASILFGIQFLADPAQTDIDSRRILTLLLPIGVLSVVGVLVRRALHLHRRAPGDTSPPRQRRPHFLRTLVYPASQPAAAMRAFGAVLLVGFIPAAAPFLLNAGHISAPVATYVVGLGTLLVHLGLFLVFLTYVRTTSSFVTRTFSIALVLLLALFGVVALLVTSARNEQFRQVRQWQIATVQLAVQHDSLTMVPESVAYIAARSSPGEQHESIRIYPPQAAAGTAAPQDMQFIASEDQLRHAGGGILDRFGVRTMDYVRELTTVPDIPSVLRYADRPIGSIPRYIAYQVPIDDQYYETGFRLADDLDYINQENLKLIILLLVSSLILWIALRLFLRTHLLQPLGALLGGVRQANTGTTTLNLPVYYEDEIGFLTRSFNSMVHSINTAQHNLREANLHLEERVQQRTAALQQEMLALQQANQQINEQQQAIAMLRERERLARELHDNLGQVLGFVNMQTQAARDALKAEHVPQTHALLDQIAEVARSTLTDIREYILGVQVGTTLHSSEPEAPTSGAFAAALETYLHEFAGLWNIHTTLHLPPAAREVAFAPTIETHLFRIVQEALTNVRKHTSATHVEVALQIPLPLTEGAIDAHDRVLTVTISDNGQGFAAHSLNGSPLQGGQGFGLTSMRGRVAEIGGTLTIESTADTGTTITVQVPLRRQGDIVQQPLRLLLVDDNALFLRGLHSLLTANGFQVVGTAGNGHEAQTQARTLQPDIILMDVQMPECDGLEATRMIKAELPHIQIVMLTISDDDAHLFEAIKHGATGYLLKSLESDELCTLLLGLMRGEVPFSPGLATRVLQELVHAGTGETAPADESPVPETQLNEQQITLLTLLAQGYTQQDIGERMGYTRRTISRHLATIIDTLHLSNRAEAIAYARQKLEQGDWPTPPDDND